MKKTILVLVAICLSSLAVVAQKEVKLAHVDIQAIFTVMPEKATATKEVEEYAKSLEDQMQTMYKEYETKMTEYNSNKANWSDLIKQDKESEIMSLQQRIQTFQQQAETDLANREAVLLEPIQTKIKDAINAVAAEQGLTYVYDASLILYKSPSSTDITEAVKTKLGIK